MLNPINKYRISKKLTLFLINSIDNMGYSFFNHNKFAKNLEEDIKQDRIKKILVVKLDDIGDVILTTPFVHNLRKKFPRTEITFMAKSSTKDVFANNPYIDRIISFEPFWMRTKKHFSFFQIAKLILKLRKAKYDLIFELREYPQNILLDYLLGSKYLVSYGNQGLGFLLTNLIPYDKKVKHNLERNLDILRALNIPIISKKPEIFISERDKEFARDFFRKHKISNRFVFCIHPGSPWPPKRWPQERFVTLIDRLLEKYNVKFILIGSKDEIALNNKIIGLVKEENKKKVTNAAGKTTVTQLAALIKKCNLFIGNDSGPMHIASALNKPLIALFGPTDVTVWRPEGKKSKVIHKKTRCSPCIQKIAERCKFFYPVCKALLKISTTEVIGAVGKLEIGGFL